MIEVFGIVLLRPWWLLALPALAVLAMLGVQRLKIASAWANAIQPALLAALERLGRASPAGTRSASSVTLLATAAAAIAVALSGPAREARDGATFRNLDAVVLVVDLSRSVTGGGRLPDALMAARMVAENAESRPVALVVFAGDAYVASNFTTDADVLGTTVAVLDGETVPERGDRPERALALARRTLKDASIVFADVVMVSAGGGIGDAALGEAEALRQNGYRVSALYVEPVEPGASASPRGALHALARTGGGTLSDVRNPTDVVSEIGARHASRLAASTLSVLIWRDYGRWLLLTALAPALLLFRRRG